MVPARIVLGVLGATLVLAAALKADALMAEGVAGPGLLSVGWVVAVVVAVEAVAGVYLLVGGQQLAARWVALACFSLFAGASAAEALNGASSCACFGRWAVSPWVMASVDGLVVATLLTIICGGTRATTRRSRWGILGMVGALVIGGATVSQLPAGVMAGERTFGLRPSVDAIDFGTVPSGGEVEQELWLANTSTRPVVIQACETSCGCLRIKMPERTIAPGDEVRAVAKLDLSHHEEFHGRLQISIVIAARSGEKVSIIAQAVVLRE